jgi:predicted nucleotidyltransferase component of viral defense system
LPVEFYLTGGTALSREYLHHRFSDDLDFFINASETFKDQVEIVFKALKGDFSNVEVVVADEDFARSFCTMTVMF